MKVSNLTLSLIAGFLLLFQASLTPLLALPELAWPMPYVFFWLLLPFSWPTRLSLLLATAYGLLLDIVFPPPGLHTFCGLWLWALRKTWLQTLHPNLPAEWQASFSIDQLSSGEFLAYALPLTFIHHLLYFTLGRWSLHGTILLQALLSTIYTFLWEWLIFELFLRQKYARR
ncbi:MAG: hypothetical protein N3A68_06555 [Bacteroidia bacterium]|jgi:hypothetical protein|nr:hypothetical protein [Bacteroidia bacterium]GIV22704.1 MAG: hypothetical protein KatS3mg025_0363 [Bacteroidia bacterium]